MNVLVAEDDEDKLEQTQMFLTLLEEVRDIVVAKSLQSCLRAINERDFDLLILDMTMPTFDRTLSEEGGRPHAFAGREVLRQMRRRRIETPVIILTSFDRFGEESDYTTLDQLKHELKSNFPNYTGTVQLKANVDDWRDALRDLLGGVLKGESF